LRTLIARTRNWIAVHEARVAKLESEGKDTTRAGEVLDILIEVHAYLCDCVGRQVERQHRQRDASAPKLN
jgi:hypothetical protein